jgi:hypothetical protein
MPILVGLVPKFLSGVKVPAGMLIRGFEEGTGPLVEVVVAVEVGRVLVGIFGVVGVETEVVGAPPG